jgi:succinate dehydrogenase/fumarate reductase flavoprotein subunit
MDHTIDARTGERFDETVDVVVVGFGYAGGVAAIEAHDAGASVILLEKASHPGGISICSGGGARAAKDAETALLYLKATCGGRTPEDVLAVLAHGMVEIGDYLKNLAEICDAKVSSTLERSVEWEAAKRGGNYPLPGWETFHHYNIDEIPGFDLATEFPHVKGYGSGGGARVFKIVHDHVKARPIDVRFEASVQQLITNDTREVTGVRVATPNGERRIKARKGVVLACGGFEANEEMKRQYWQMAPVLPVMARTNTGDGIRMAQELGADLWHMWHYHGSYGFKHPDPDYPYAVRMKRLPDWFPDDNPHARVPMAWILVDRAGQRFMNENHPYTQDTNARPMELFDPATQSFPRVPSYMICDEDGRKMYRLGMVTYNEEGLGYQWSEDNLAEVEMGILRRAGSVTELAEMLEMDGAVLQETIDRWNGLCAQNQDDDFGRPPGSLTPVRTPPFYVGEVWPVVSNTQGGPVHNADQQILDVNAQPIARLYAAGELGSAFGFLYVSGGNLTECFITGRIAGRGAARLDALD